MRGLCTSTSQGAPPSELDVGGPQQSFHHQAREAHRRGDLQRFVMDDYPELEGASSRGAPPRPQGGHTYHGNSGFRRCQALTRTDVREARRISAASSA